MNSRSEPTPGSLTVFCSLGLRGVLARIAEDLNRNGFPVAVSYGPTQALLQTIAAGGRADVAILVDSSIAALKKDGTLQAAGGRDLARAGLGLAVRAGAEKPDISTCAALKSALLAAPSIAYSLTGASGLYFAEVLRRLGIAEAMAAKSRVQDGLVGELAARGEVALAVQQLSELAAVSGIDIVGPFPPDLQKITTFSAGIFSGSTHCARANELLELLGKPEIRQMLREAGLDPI